MQMLKGWAFVLATSGLIFFLMRREMTRFFKAAESQRTSEANFRLLVENAPDAIFVQTKSQFAYLNSAAIDLFGAKDANKLIGTPVMERYHPDFHDVIRERIHRVTDDKLIASPIEQVYMKMDGGHVSVEVKSVPIEYKGENGALVFARDVTERKVAEEALRRFELLVENSRDIILFVNREDGRILEANTAAAAAYGYSRDELVSLRVQDLRAPDTLDLAPEQMAKADREGILFETIHRRRDGTTFPVEISSRGATINGVRTLISVCRDITARKQAEEELRKSEARFRILADSMPQLVWTALPDGRMDYFNRRIDNYKGIVKQPDGNWEWSGVVHPDDLGLTLALWQHALSTGMAQEIEHRLLQSDGSYKWHLSRTNPVHDQKGHVVKWYGTSTEIDRQKRAEAALSESESRLRLALDSAQMSIWECDLSKNHLAWEGAHRELFGVNPDQFSTIESLQDFVHPEDRALVAEATREAIENRNPFGTEFRIILPTGELRWIRSQGRLVGDQNNQPSRLLGVVWDVTDRKHAQQQLLEANKRLDFLVTESPAVVFTYDLRPQPHGNYISRNLEVHSRLEARAILGKFRVLEGVCSSGRPRRHL